MELEGIWRECVCPPAAGGGSPPYAIILAQEFLSSAQDHHCCLLGLPMSRHCAHGILTPPHSPRRPARAPGFTHILLLPSPPAQDTMQVDWQVRQVWAQHPRPPLTAPQPLTPQFPHP